MPSHDASRRMKSSATLGGMADPAAPTSFPRILPSGVDGLVVRFADTFDDTANRAALALRARIEAERWPEVVETAPALVSTLIRFDPLATDREALADRLRTLLGRDWQQTAPAPRSLMIPACFDPDLAPQIDEAAEAAGFLSRQAAIDSICAADLRVLTIGFAPGQPYIGELPAPWNLPRQRSLTPRVPVGALGVAIRQMVLFAVETQTGWRHVGQTAMRVFQPGASDAFLLRPGDRLRFQPVTASALAPLWDDPLGGARIEDAS